VETTLSDRTGVVKKKILQRWLPSLLSLIFLGIAVYYLWESHLFDKIDLSHPQWGWLFILVILQALSLGVIGYSESLYIRHLGVHLTFVEWFGLNVASSVINLVTPIAGGAVLRAGYYQWQHKLHPARFTPLLAATSLITYLVCGIVGLILLGVFVVLGLGGEISWVAPMIFVGLIVAPLIALAVPIERLPLPKGRIADLVRLALGGWAEIRTSPSLLAKQFGLVLILQVLQATSMIVGITGLGLDAPALPLFFVGIVLGAWRVTPAFGVGAKEVIATLAASLVGLNPTLGLLGALANRLATWVCVFTLGPLFSYILSRRLGKSLGSVSQAVNVENVVTK
jgi:MFS family permease